MTDDTSTNDATAPFVALMALQDLDLDIAQSEHRKSSLPGIATLKSIEAERVTIREALGALDTERSALLGAQSDLEAEIEHLRERAAAIEARLLGAAGGAARDLQAMDTEVIHIRERQGALEDQELAIMEQLEPLDATAGELASTMATLDDRFEATKVIARSELSDAESELAGLQARRPALAAAVPSDLVARYDALRVRLKGVGAARLNAARCEGCHLEFSTYEVERLRALAIEVVSTCDQCGRILVRPSQLA